MTEELFREDAYLRACEAEVLAAVMTPSGPGVVLDRTVFYPEGGGQPGDAGTLTPLTPADGAALAVVDTRKGETGSETGIIHRLADGCAPPAPGTRVTAEIDWGRRHKFMRMHSAMHLVCSLVKGDVTGGQVGAEKSRLDFNLPDTQIDKEALTAALNALIEADHPLAARWISDDELARQPELVRTMSVKPPSGSGRVRLIEIEGVDLQPCGGTHVRSTGEIGPLRVGKVENKGRMNRRINIHFA
ncbi:MAG: alanyl-tRNA editing protein [Rhodospirillales bacterium]